MLVWARVGRRADRAGRTEREMVEQGAEQAQQRGGGGRREQ